MNRDILAVILKYAVSEFADLDIDEISLLIDPDSITEDREVSYDRTNSIRGENTDFSSVSEKTVNFDILFSAVNPRLSNETVKVNLYIDLEPQGDYTPGYHIQSRGMYYLSRALSSQLGIITEKTDSSQLEKVYSIWICYRNIPKDLQNSISFYKMTNYKNIGIEQGIEETKLIFKLHMSGFSNEQIAAQTGLPLEKINAILS